MGLVEERKVRDVAGELVEHRKVAVGGQNVADCVVRGRLVGCGCIVLLAAPKRPGKVERMRRLGVSCQEANKQRL